MTPRPPKTWATEVLASVSIALGAAHAVAAPGEHVIGPAALVSVLSKEGAAITAQDIHLSPGIVARQPHPQLLVLSVEPVADQAGRYWVRFGCRNASDCLPFYASVSSSRPLSCGVRQRVVAPVVQAGVAVIHPGDHATLVIHRERSLIQIAVVALESGSIGRSIRVATPDYKQVFHGQVVSSTELEGVM